MKSIALTAIIILFTLPAVAQQITQSKPGNAPVPDCGAPIPALVFQSPVSQTVCPGSNATFIASAHSAGRYWQMSTDNGITWNAVPPNSYLSPFNESIYQPDTLIIFSVGTGMNGYQFRCEYAGFCRGSTFTSAATLTVAAINTEINSQPQNVSTCKFTAADFVVAATGSSLAYQWQVSTTGGIDFTNIQGKTDTVLHIDSVRLDMNNYRYRCIVTSECNPSVISSVALLTVQDESTHIVTQPLTQTACVNSIVSLMVVASGNMITYQWQNNTNSGYTDIAGATSPTLMASYNIPSTQEYRCKISSTCKTIYSNTARIFYTAPPETVPLSNKYACSGETVSIPSFHYAEITGIPGIEYHFQWQFSTDGGINFINIPGDTLGYKTVIASQQVNNYKYRCYLTSTCFTGYSDTMTLLVDVPVSITMQPQNKNGCLDHEVNFSVKATGSISGYQWQRSIDGGINYEDFSCCGNGIWSSDLILTYFTAAYNNNLYRCKIISNCFDTVYSNPATLSVYNNPVAGNDTSTEVNCDSCKTNVAALFNTSGFAKVVWNVDSSNAGPGKHELKVFNIPGCFDVAYAYVNVHEADTLKVCRNSTTSFHSSLSGSNYQWQINTGAGFYDISGVNGITGSSTADITFQYTGTMQIRCKVDNASYSNTTFVKITAYWTGASDSDWNNPLNWSCDEVPFYGDTDVIIMSNSPHKPEVRTNSGCKKLFLKPGAEIIIKPGVELFISGN